MSLVEVWLHEMCKNGKGLTEKIQMRHIHHLMASFHKILLPKNLKFDQIWQAVLC